MKLTLNGKEGEFPGIATVADLVALLKLDQSRIATEVNLKLVRKADYARTPLKDGDRVEVVTFVGGG